MSLRVAIAGGGLAGLTCAKYLADAGCAVTLYEGAQRLGGRAATWRGKDGEWVETGLHTYLGVYTELTRLLAEIGQDLDQVVAWTDDLRLRTTDGGDATLSWTARLSLLALAAPAALPLTMLRDGFDHLSVAAWWRQSGGQPEVMEHVLRPLCRALQATEPEDFSAYNFLGWLHHVGWALPWNRLGAYRGARSELVFAPLAAWLRQHGVVVEVGTGVGAVLHDGHGGDERWGRVSGLVTTTGERVEADAYVLAVPAWAVDPLLPPALQATGFFERISRMPTAPAVSVQLWFDREAVGHGGFTLLSGADVPIYQDQAPVTYPWQRGSRVSLLIAPADQLVMRDDYALVATALRALRASEPRAREANVVKSVVQRFPQHLVRPLPGAMSARPSQATPVPNLFLAGDWTQQPFFGSQEGAVRGGKAAAAAIIRSFRPALRVTWAEDAEVEVLEQA